MPAGGNKQQSGQGHEQNITDLAGHVGHHACKYDDRCQEKPRSIEHDNPEAGADETGVLGHTDADQRHQHRPERRKAGEIADQAAHDALQTVGTEQIDRIDQLAGLGVRYREVELAGKPAGNDNKYREKEKQSSRMRQ